MTGPGMDYHLTKCIIIISHDNNNNTLWQLLKQDDNFNLLTIV